MNNGVVFALANLDFTLEDRPGAGAALSGGYGRISHTRLAIRASYALLPYRPKTARVHAFMRQEDGTPWEGCPAPVSRRWSRLTGSWATGVGGAGT
ncbi:MAG: hypothetical protein R2838_02800 [Caldilineaceae bacterium]